MSTNDRNPFTLSRRSLLVAITAAGPATLLPCTAHAAFDLSCNWQAGIVMDPNEKRRFGYLTAFNGLGLATALAPDIAVSLPFTKGATPTYPGLRYVAPSNESSTGSAKVVGLIENFSWNGGVGDPISISAYVSQENAIRIKALQQLTLRTTAIKELGWWIADYDEEVKKWFEQAFPKQPDKITGQVRATGKDDLRLDVSLTPEKVGLGIDVDVYKMRIEVAPAANRQQLRYFATSKRKEVVKSWGVVVDNAAKSSLP